MNNLFIINENISSGYLIGILNIFSFLAILCGIFVIIVKNPIISVLFLIGLFSSISCYLISLDISFIGLSYLIVYIGAISILFLFILMLINIRISELQNDTTNSIPLAIIISILLTYPLFQILPYNIITLNNYNNFLFNLFDSNDLDLYTNNLNNNNLLFVSSKMWDGYLTEVDHITNIGSIMYTNYNIWLIITSFILLLAMVGSIIITMKQKN